MKTKEETLKKVISESDYFISEDHWVWTIAIKAMEEYAKENLREELIGFRNYFNNECYGSIEAWIIDEYLKQKQ